MEEEKREHDAKMKKMETEMEQVFEMKVKEKKQKLKDSETEVTICYWLHIKYMNFWLYFRSNVGLRIGKGMNRGILLLPKQQ